MVDEDGDEVKREGGDEGDEMDRQGVYHALSIVENLCSRPATAEVLGADEALVRWILARAARKEEGDGVSQNKQYAAEVFAILAQASPVNRKRLAELEGAIDTLLQLAAPYRRRDPSDLLGGEEEEYLADVFEALTCLVDEPVGKIEFVKAEGVELCLLMLRDLGKSSHKNKADKSGKAAAKASKEKVNPCGPLALRLLDHATSGISPEASDACVRLVGEAAGLGTLGSLLMRTRDADRARMEPLANILSSLLRLLPPESDERIRAVGKLCEKDHEKLRKLVGARAVYARRVEAVDARARQERNGEDEEDEEARREREIEAVGRRLDAGLYLVQTIDSILAWVVAEDPSAKKGLVEALKSVGESLADVRQSMQDQIAELDEETEEGRYYKEMLTTLLDFVK